MAQYHAKHCESQHPCKLVATCSIPWTLEPFKDACAVPWTVFPWKFTVAGAFQADSFCFGGEGKYRNGIDSAWNTLTAVSSVNFTCRRTPQRMQLDSSTRLTSIEHLQMKLVWSCCRLDRFVRILHVSCSTAHR